MAKISYQRRRNELELLLLHISKTEFFTITIHEKQVGIILHTLIISEYY